jgi:hypothetical protein
VPRTAVLQAVAARAPELLPFVQWVYSCPSRLWVAGREEGAPAILSTTGVRQSDPMNPLLFALALQQPLEESIAAVLNSHLVAIHDDVTLVALPEKVAALFSVNWPPALPPLASASLQPSVLSTPQAPQLPLRWRRHFLFRMHLRAFWSPARRLAPATSWKPLAGTKQQRCHAPSPS